MWKWLSKTSDMKQQIEYFLQEKQLSQNSYQAYFYDLQQFVELCQGQLTEAKLAIYRAFLQTAKPSVQRRKISAVNQFLYFLYERGAVERFYKLKPIENSLSSASKKPTLVDLSALWQETDYQDGQLIALLITTMGLLPSELALIRQEDINLEFEILTLGQAKDRRIIPLPKDLLPFLKERPSSTFLFDKKGKTYSRQWFFNRLTEFTKSLGKPEWTAQKLREQYILRQLSTGKTVEELAKELGLSSRMSLEKYR